jgi:peptide/nickel transport system substrate-binding protein
MSRDRTESVRLMAEGLSRRRFLGGTIMGLSLFAVTGLSGCASGGSVTGDGASSAGQPRRGGILRTAIGDVSTNDKLDPALAVSSTAAFLNTMLYSPLVRTGLDYKLQPSLAESWSINQNGAEWVFHIRPGVRFHDGAPLTAADAAWTIKRILDKDLASPLRSKLVDDLDPAGIEVVDDATLKLTLKRSNYFLGESLANYNAGIVKANQSTFTTANAIGAGPFRLVSFTPGQSFEVTRNPQYFEPGLPYLDGIQNAKIDPTTVLLALGSGSLDWTDSLSPKSVARLQGDDRFTSPALRGDKRAVRTYFLHMKLDAKPFDDPRVVMAFKLAANREVIRTSVLADLGTISPDVPVPQDDPAYPKQLGERRQNIAEARRLLAEAGYPNGIDIDLPTADFQPGMVDFSISYAQTVRPAGIRVHVKQVPVDTYFDRVFAQVPLFHDYAQRLSAYSMLNTFFQKGGAYNGTGFDKDGALTAYLDRALVETDETKRTQILSDALEYTANNSGTVIAFWVPIVHTSRSNVHGDLYSPIYSWDRLWIEQ